jgi:hypothetical protein
MFYSVPLWQKQEKKVSKLAMRISKLLRRNPFQLPRAIRLASVTKAVMQPVEASLPKFKAFRF